MKSLYRRYRPTKLEEVIGQEQVTEPLMKSLEAGKVGHAYLFVGPRGCGKTSVARILAHEVNGFDYEIEDNYVDIIEIDGASNRGIDNIRDLREMAAIAPTVGKYKVYIIDEVHMLTKEAFNALLKTLEEPPKHVIFIMATTEIYKVPITITSRAQTFTFKLAEPQVMFDFLKQVCEREKIKIDDNALNLIVRRGGGSFRDSLSLLDQLSTLSDEEITKEMIIRAMGLPEDEGINKLLDAYRGGDIAEVTKALRDILASGVKPTTLVDEIIAKIIEQPTPELMPLLAKLTDVKAPYEEARLLVALSSGEPTFSDGRPRAQSSSQHFAQSSPRSSCQPAQPETSLGNFTRLGRGKVDKNDTGSAGILPEKVGSPNDPESFDWDGFANRVQELNDAVYSQLVKCDHDFSGGELRLYPKRKIVQTILSRDNNKRILVGAGGSVKITICEVGETPNNVKPDETLSKISAIMGGEVRNDGGANPF